MVVHTFSIVINVVMTDILMKYCIAIKHILRVKLTLNNLMSIIV